MPSKKKKYNSRFPPARIKKIMQADEEVGKVAAVVPVMISRTLEIFVESLLKNASEVTRSRNARTLTPAHLKASILGDNQFSFLREVVSSVADIQQVGDEEQLEGNATSTATGTALSVGTKFNRRTSKSTTSLPGRGRGRPRKTSSSRPNRSTSQVEEEEEDHNEEDDDEEDEEEEMDDEDENEEGSSCDNSSSNILPSSSASLSKPKVGDPPLTRAQGLTAAQEVDDDYDA